MTPYSTDAPLYHLPIGNGVLILANVVCFMVHGHPTSGAWILEFGGILNPLEWVSSMFAHAGIGHLLGNMYFLAVFGLIVEGKLGFKRFLLLYLSTGLIDSALTQLIMLPSGSTGALGASSAIMGLMAICLVWAPKNELSVFLFVLHPVFLGLNRRLRSDLPGLGADLFHPGRLQYEHSGLAPHRVRCRLWRRHALRKTRLGEL